MAFNFGNITDPHEYLKDESRFVTFLTDYASRIGSKHKKLGLYYTDEQIQQISEITESSVDGRTVITGQEIGMPFRIVGRILGGSLGGTTTVDSSIKTNRKEPMTENEIGWRVDALGNKLYGKSDSEPLMTIESDLEDGDLKDNVEALLKAVVKAQLEPNWFHEYYEVGAIHGFVDCSLRMSEQVEVEVGNTSGDVKRWTLDGESFKAGDFESFAKVMQWHIASPFEVAPLVDPRMPSKLWGWVLHYQTQVFPNSKVHDNADIAKNQRVSWIELYVPGLVQVYRLDPRVDEDGYQQFGEDIFVPESILPVVHLQHSQRRNAYEGIGEVEPLIPLQDELNTRLSDRGRGVTYGANPPWLAKNISNFENMPIGPEVRYSGDEDSELERISTDSNDEGQNTHIDQVRDGLDRISSIPPVAAGDVKDQLGNLTSSVALKVVLAGMVAKIDRVRAIHSPGIEAIAFNTLTYANATGTLLTTPEQRKVTVKWGNVVSESSEEKLANAIQKRAIGVPDDQLQKELGYTEDERKAFAAAVKQRDKDLFGSMSDNEDDDT